jgi:dihydrofolate reductase
MRKITVLEHITLDGVIQAGGGPDEDRSGGFKYGGWQAPFDDDAISAAVKKMLELPIDLLLGRKTFEIWAGFWPQHGDFWPRVNQATKYVASNTMRSHAWQPSVFLNGDVAKKVADLKQGEGPDLHIWGSSVLVQTLMQHDLVDNFWLMIYPITLGQGKKLFADGTVPAAFKVTESIVGSSGVIQVNYERAGLVQIGEVEAED